MQNHKKYDEFKTKSIDISKAIFYKKLHNSLFFIVNKNTYE